jgi:hypothetical protein
MTRFKSTSRFDPPDDDVTEEAHQDDEGRFRTVVSGATGQSIDACEQALLGLNYPALREALSRPLSEVSRQAASHGVERVKKHGRRGRWRNRAFEL